MGFSVKKRDMHFFPFKNVKNCSKKRDKAKKSETAVFFTSKIGTVPPK